MKVALLGTDRCTHQAHLVLRQLIMPALLALLGACGGGGGGGGGGNSPDSRVSVSTEPSLVSATIVEGQTFEPRLMFTGTLNHPGDRNIYLGVNNTDGLAVDYGISIRQGGFDGIVALKTGYAPGTQRGELLLLVCYDTLCREPVAGSPFRIPLQLVVLPNIQVAPTTTLARTGREPAPTINIAVTVPAAAGEVQVDGATSGPDMTVQWLGNALRVTTTQLPAGTYTRDVVISSRTNPVYSTTTRIVYRVDAPPGGERPMGFIGPAGEFAVVEQGQVYRQRWRLQRPTWSDAPTSVTLADTSGRVRLEALGGDEYEVSLDTANLPVGTILTPSVTAEAPPTGGQSSLSYRLEVGGAFGVNLPGVQLDGASTADSLTTSGAVTTFSGPAAGWTARSLSPWLRLRNSSGVTGVDRVVVEFDAAAVLARRGWQEGAIEFTIDRVGSLPAVVPVAVDNRVPQIGPSYTAALLPGKGRVYLDGVLDPYSGVSRNLLVQGATLDGARLNEDTRFIGFLAVLQADLQGLTVGQTVTLRSTWPLMTTEVRVPVVDVPRLAAGFAALPLKRWRSAQFSLSQGALYFAGDGAVARWLPTGGAGSLLTASVPGLQDAALYGNESNLLGAGGTRTWLIDATTLVVQADGSLLSSPFFDGLALEALTPATLSALAVAADGAPLTAVRNGGASGAVAMITAGGQFRPLTGPIGHGTDPGSAGYAGNPGIAQAGVGLVRSPAGEIVIGVYPSGALRVYRAPLHMPAFSGRVPEGRSLRAVSDDGTRLLLDDGSLMLNGTAVAGSLSDLLPAGFTAGGFGLSGNGRYGLVYLYRQVSEGSMPRAREAALWTVDLAAVASTGLVAGTPVVARELLADAVGCNAALSPDETCSHQAQVIVAPGDGTAFVLGPRGVAAVPLPALVSAAAATGPRRSILRGFVPAQARPRTR